MPWIHGATRPWRWPCARPDEPHVCIHLHQSLVEALNVKTAMFFLAVFAAHRLLKSGVAGAARARLMTRGSGVTMLGLGAFSCLGKA